MDALNARNHWQQHQKPQTSAETIGRVTTPSLSHIMNPLLPIKTSNPFIPWRSNRSATIACSSRDCRIPQYFEKARTLRKYATIVCRASKRKLRILLVFSQLEKNILPSPDTTALFSKYSESPEKTTQGRYQCPKANIVHVCHIFEKFDTYAPKRRYKALQRLWFSLQGLRRTRLIGNSDKVTRDSHDCGDPQAVSTIHSGKLEAKQKNYLLWRNLG